MVLVGRSLSGAHDGIAIGAVKDQPDGSFSLRRKGQLGRAAHQWGCDSPTGLVTSKNSGGGIKLKLTVSERARVGRNSRSPAG
jgi:hypothetical protein